MTIDFLNTSGEELSEACQRAIQTAIEVALSEMHFEKSAEVSVVICSNDEIRELNNQYRGKDTVTDVLSFPLSDEMDFNEGNDVSLGDIVICLPRAREQAQEIGNTLERELAFLAVHSVLHLLGYDHEADKQSEEEMFALQDKIVEKIQFTD